MARNNQLKKKINHLNLLNLLGIIFLILPLLNVPYDNFSTNTQEVEKDKQKTDIDESPESSDSGIPRGIGNEVYAMQNVSQFDVEETILSQTQFQYPIDPMNESIQIPTGWDFDTTRVNVSAVYKPYQVFQNQFLEGGITTPWNFYTSHPNQGFINQFYMGPINDNNLGTEVGINLPLKIPHAVPADDAAAIWFQGVKKPRNDFSIYETNFVSSGRNEYPVVDEYNYNPPNYIKNYSNPYGGDSGTSSRTLEWRQSETLGGYLESFIQAGQSNVSLGNPSIGWERNFSFPLDFTPKYVVLYVVWSVQNLGYEAHENMSVIARVDKKYVDGRTDLHGNRYYNATATTIETDCQNATELVDHGYITRIFDVTNLINYNDTVHYIDFGLWFKNLDQTDDAVRVNFDTIAIQAIEEDQYKIGDVGFHAEITNLAPYQSELYDWIAFYYLNGNGKEVMYPLGFLSDLFMDGNMPVRDFNFELTSRNLEIMNASLFSIGLGILCVNDTAVLNQQKFSFTLDNLYLNLSYRPINFDDLGLQFWNGTSWMNVTNPVFNSSTPYTSNNFEIAFRVNNTGWYNNSIIDLKCDTWIHKTHPNESYASYYIDSNMLTMTNRGIWNVTFNNTATITQLASYAYHNFEVADYDITLIDIPAFDGLGNDSMDWRPLNIFDPLGQMDTISGARFNGTGNNPYTQNLTFLFPIYMVNNSFWINGSWTVKCDQPNYLNLISTVNATDLSTLTHVYKNTETFIYVNQTKFVYAGSSGNYNLTIKNVSNTILSLIPHYNSSIANNLSNYWLAQDAGIGIYSIYALWNDTNPSSQQTTRIGLQINNIEMWRKTLANITAIPPSLQSGTPGSFRFNFSQSEDFHPISGASAYTKLYRKTTNNLWGMDWPPYQYQIDSILEDNIAPGNYTLKFKTIGIPLGTYDTYITIDMLYYDPQTIQIYEESQTQIIITGLQMNVGIIKGVTNSSSNYTLDIDNLPFVNDTKTSIIQLNVSNSTSQLQDGFISGVFNASTRVFYGVEIYSITHDPLDYGLYNITLDTTGLNTTYREDIADYNLTLTISVPGYESISLNITCIIKPLPTYIESTFASDLFEGGSFTIDSTYQNALNPGPLNNGNMTWWLNNASNGNLVASGNFSFILSGVYRAIISLSFPNYVNPGIYNLTVKANLLNCQDAEWIQTNLIVFEKYYTNLSVSISNEVRIGSLVDINTKFTYINQTVIPGAEIIFKITYAGTDTFIISKTTDSNGLASYSQIVPFQYANTNIEVNVTFSGNSTVKSANASIFKPVLGKLYSELNITGTIARVGYTVDLTGSIVIEGYTQYTGIFLTLSAWYDGDYNSPILIKELHCSEDGKVTFTTSEIANNHDNITFFMDYAGTQTISYNSTSLPVAILPKWVSNLSLGQLPASIRIGQNILLNFSAWFDDLTCNESFYGLALDVLFEYQGGTSTLQLFFNINNSILYTYEIPQNAGSFLNITLTFQGTNRILNYSKEYYHLILPKWALGLLIQDLPNMIRVGQTISLNIKGIFLDALCDESFFGIPVLISINSGGISKTFNGSLNQQGVVNFTWVIAIAAQEKIDLTVSSIGTTRIGSNTTILSHNLLPQLKTSMIITNAAFQQGFAGDFYFTVQLLDENQNKMGGYYIYFIVRNDANKIVGNYSAITNEEGIASISINIEEIGTYTVEIQFKGHNYYAGISTVDTNIEETIRVVNYGVLMLDNIYTILIVVGSALLLGLLVQRTIIIPRRKRQMSALMEIHRKFADIENIQYILIMHKKTSLALFSRAFTEIPIDETLISGFLSAINSFGQEIGSKVKQEGSGDLQEQKGGLEELGYKQFKIVVLEGEIVRTAVLCLKSSSPTLRDKIKAFNRTFEQKYTAEITNWDGKVLESDPIMEMLEQALNVDLLYPHNIVLNKVPTFISSARNNSVEAVLIKVAQTPSFNNTFKVREMINQMAGFGKKEVDTFNAIHELRKKGILFAINPRTKYLIDQFKPMIDQLKPQAIAVLTLYSEGLREKNKIEKRLKIPDITPYIIQLEKARLLDKKGNFTETGEIISTLINLMPDLRRN